MKYRTNYPLKLRLIEKEMWFNCICENIQCREKSNMTTCSGTKCDDIESCKSMSLKYQQHKHDILKEKIKHL